MYREKQDERVSREEQFKAMLIANFPERAESILDGFQEDDEFARVMSPDELDTAEGMNSDELEAAHDLFAKLFDQGGAIQPYDA